MKTELHGFFSFEEEPALLWIVLAVIDLNRSKADSR